MVPGFDSSNRSEASGPWSGIGQLQSACLEMILLHIDSVFPVGESLFTHRERLRLERMGPRRRKSFMAARVALKRLARQLGLVEKTQPDRTIETLGPDDRTALSGGKWIILFCLPRLSDGRGRGPQSSDWGGS